MPRTPKILCVYYSFSGQTTKLVRAFAEGFVHGGGEAVIVRLHPVEKIHFPFQSIFSAFWMMFRTLFRIRDKVSERAGDAEGFDAVLIGGPTWSFNPSGPVLSWLDEEGREVLANKRVVPLISCRGYWGLHHWELKRAIKSLGGTSLSPLVFTHPVAEPWRSVGVFLSLVGKRPERMPFFGKRYPRYGHSSDQVEDARRLGSELAHLLAKEGDEGPKSGWRGLVA